MGFLAAWWEGLRPRRAGLCAALAAPNDVRDAATRAARRRRSRALDRSHRSQAIVALVAALTANRWERPGGRIDRRLSGGGRLAGHSSYPPLSG
jgi:hypothetical protein